jgi:hypothetical protein
MGILLVAATAAQQVQPRRLHAPTPATRAALANATDGKVIVCVYVRVFFFCVCVYVCGDLHISLSLSLRLSLSLGNCPHSWSLDNNCASATCHVGSCPSTACVQTPYTDVTNGYTAGGGNCCSAGTATAPACPYASYTCSSGKRYRW